MVSAISARGTVTTTSWMSCSRRRSAPMALPAWIVPIPPGWPVPHALSRSRASDRAPRRSECDQGAGGARSGRDRRAKRRRPWSASRPDSARRIAARAYPRSAPPIGGLGDFGQQSVGERGLAGGRAPGDEDVPALGDRAPKRFGLARDHDPGRDVIVEREHGDGGVYGSRRSPP